MVNLIYREKHNELKMRERGNGERKIYQKKRDR